jgi:hypothetical protein
MAKRAKLGDIWHVRVGPEEYRDYVLGPDVDLDKEVVLDGDGRRITEARVQEIVEEVRHKVGRPSLSGPSEHSPHMSFRVPHELAKRAETVAAREGKSLSQLGREALAQYLEKAG